MNSVVLQAPCPSWAAMMCQLMAEGDTQVLEHPALIHCMVRTQQGLTVAPPAHCLHWEGCWSSPHSARVPLRSTPRDACEWRQRGPRSCLPAHSPVGLGEHVSVHQSESVSHSVVSDSLPLQGLQPTRLLCPLNSPGKNIGVAFPVYPNPSLKRQHNRLPLGVLSS